MADRLKNTRCLLIGATAGIGLAAARRFVAEGARVVVVGREPLDGLHVAGLRDSFTITADVTDSEAVEHVFRDAVTHFGGLDVLYHVAGGSGRRFGDGPLHECTDDGWQATLDLNLKSVFLTNRAAVRQFLQQGSGGVILNMASMLALAPSPHHFDTAAYTASKGGVIALSRYAAARYAGDKIRVNVLAPGLIDTPMAARAMGEPAIQRFLQSKQPLGPGAGTPDDCTGAAVFLCSDEARFITGAVLPVDGGWGVSDGQFAGL